MNLAKLASLIIFWLLLCSPAIADNNVKIIKVLKHYLDSQGRISLAPSLFERDAYQEYLRKNPDQQAGLRFDINWKGKKIDPKRLYLRLELRGSLSHQTTPLVIEKQIEPKNLWFSKWSYIKIDKATLDKLGYILAWRVTLLEADQALASSQSFMW
jgi:hypothetical protein